MRIADEIRKALKEKSKTQRWLSEKLQCDERTLSNKFSNGYFTAEELLLAAKYLDIDLNLLVKDEPELYWLINKSVDVEINGKGYRSKSFGFDSEKNLLLNVGYELEIQQMPELGIKPLTTEAMLSDDGTASVKIFRSYLRHSVFDFNGWGSALYEKLLTENRLTIFAFSTEPKRIDFNIIEVFRIERAFKKEKWSKELTPAAYAMMSNSHFTADTLAFYKERETENRFVEWIQRAATQIPALKGASYISYELSQISKSESDLLACLHNAKL